MLLMIRNMMVVMMMRRMLTMMMMWRRRINDDGDIDHYKSYIKDDMLLLRDVLAFRVTQ